MNNNLSKYFRIAKLVFGLMLLSTVAVGYLSHRQQECALESRQKVPVAIESTSVLPGSMYSFEIR